jgi:hypothetical protein
MKRGKNLLVDVVLGNIAVLVTGIAPIVLAVTTLNKNFQKNGRMGKGKSGGMGNSTEGKVKVFQEYN